MNHTVFALEPYLQRLHYAGDIQPTEDRLEALHRAQAYTIPFENFDILLGRGISLDPSALYDKLVHHARGGYCFELNGLFLMALQAVGFEARALLARVHLNRATGDWHRDAHADRARVVTPWQRSARSFCVENNDSGDSPCRASPDAG